MAALSIQNFFGVVPIRSEQLLPDGSAVVAKNLNLIHGDIQPLMIPSVIATPTKAGVKQTIYRYGEKLAETQYWWTWTGDVDVVKAPIDGDTSERTYYTGDGYPKKTDNSIALTGGTDYPVNAYKLGVPVPITTGSSVTINGTATNTTSISTTAAWIMTYVTGWGEEGGASKPLGPSSFQVGQTYTLNNLPVAPVGNYNVTAKRLYRSNTGTSGTAYQFEADIPVAQTSYTAAVPSANLGSTIVTMGWEMPPDDGFGMTLGANGNCIILSGRTIFPSIPFILYAYPPEYHLSVESDIVGAGAFGQGFAILTRAYPYVITGVDPASYSMVKMDSKEACVSKLSIVETAGGVVYASPTGLWYINSNGMHSLTDKLYSKDQWQAFNPSSMNGCEMDSRIYMFYDTGVKQGCLIFDFGRVPYVLESDQYCTATYNDPLRNHMYMAQGGNITKWDAGATPMTYTWRAKLYRSGWYRNYGYAKVEADAYPVTFNMYSNGNLKFTKAIQNNLPFRLPSNDSRTTQVEVIGTSRVRIVSMAETGDEINAL